MKIHHYSVFAAAPGGGKQFAIVEGVTDPAEMQRIAASSGQPLTGFILNADSGLAEVRFFSPTKEKGSSDSGALVVGEHLRRSEAIQDRLIVEAGGERLEVFARENLWWSKQEDTAIKAVSVPKSALIAALGLSAEQTDEELILCTGDSKVNVIVPLLSEEHGVKTLGGLTPDFSSLASICRDAGINGVVVFAGPENSRARNYVDVWLRFFAPAKGLMEDNAGSYTVASLCGYLAEAWEMSDDFLAHQGSSMGKPSKLYVEFIREGDRAKNIQVGGKVELLEVTNV